MIAAAANKLFPYCSDFSTCTRIMSKDAIKNGGKNVRKDGRKELRMNEKSRNECTKE